jgi:hypothetical protein
MITDSCRFGALSPKVFAEFKQRYNLSLPADYEAFLLEHNGGNPIPSANRNPETEVQWIFGIHQGEYWASLEKKMQTFHGRLPQNTLPIASDPGGNLFLISLRAETYGQIWFWDHENEAEEDAGEYFGNIIKTADSFTGFIDNLYEFGDNHETKEEKIIRTNDVEGLISLLNSGYDINTKDAYCRTLLENVSIRNRIDLATVLMERKARKYNALALATKNMEFFPGDGYEPLVRLLTIYQD